MFSLAEKDLKDATLLSIGLTNLNLWKGTAAQYAAITTKNPNTIYVVKN